MSARFAMPLLEGRGAGLGNEMIVWAKAFIGSQALGLTLLDPAWGLNKRRYRRFFGSSRLDWAGHAALRTVLPLYRFGEADFLAERTGRLDAAVRRFAAANGLEAKTAYVLGFSGLWGGLRTLGAARDFLRGRLLGTRFTLENLYRLERRLPEGRLRIGMHVRRGDFSGPIPLDEYPGRFNIGLPIDWYVNIARELTRHFPGRLSFLVVSDGSAEELAPLTREFDCVTTGDMADTDISDLLALAACDLIVCSISSYSVWAAFLSPGRYAWFEPALVPDGDVASIWGHEPRQQSAGGETARSIERLRELQREGHGIRPRGVAAGPDGRLPDELLSDLESRLALARVETDLIRYGAIPRPSPR